MKLIIDIDEETYEICKAWANTATVFSEETKAIANGIPYEERPQGEWIYRNYNWWCSVCGEQPETMGYAGTALFMHNEFKFCNHCGAKMTGGVIMIGGADMRSSGEAGLSYTAGEKGA